MTKEKNIKISLLRERIDALGFASEEISYLYGSADLRSFEDALGEEIDACEKQIEALQKQEE